MIQRAAVVVPAANEERTISMCLSSILAARSQLYRSPMSVPVQVFVVLDSCHDATSELAGAFADVHLVPIAARSVGAARRAGVHAALTAPHRASELWIANTDADSEVPADWLTYMIAEARRDTHLVLGTVLPGPGLHPGLRTEWLSNHQLRDNHPHVHGANFGIRGDAYLALGGWQPARSGEDVDLAHRAATAGHLRISRPASIPVITSVRRFGRAPHGFSSYLRALGAGGDPPSKGTDLQEAHDPPCGQREHPHFEETSATRTKRVAPAR
ncbi:MAG: glycosyltransferase family 2 protein [Actinomycetota bacterium]